MGTRIRSWLFCILYFILFCYIKAYRDEENEKEFFFIYMFFIYKKTRCLEEARERMKIIIYRKMKMKDER